MKTEKLGDKFPDRRAVKWGDMTPHASHLSDEWHGMEASEGHMSEKWVDQHPSSGHMSEKWVDQHPSSGHMSEEWAEMKQESRQDPYTMFHSDGDRKQSFKPMAKEKADGGKVGRATQHTEFGSTREI